MVVLEIVKLWIGPLLEYICYLYIDTVKLFDQVLVSKMYESIEIKHTNMYFIAQKRQKDAYFSNRLNSTIPLLSNNQVGLGSPVKQQEGQRGKKGG